MPTDWLIIADGQSGSVEKIRALAVGKAVMVLDGALAFAQQYNIAVDLVIGDLDSVDPKQLEKLPKQRIIYQGCQDSTDLDKALNYLASHKAREVTICRALGGRLDHSLYNLRILRRYQQKFAWLKLIYDEHQAIFLRDTKVTLTAESKQLVALMAFPEGYVTSQGLSYEMNDYHLEFAYQESVSNAFSGTAHLTVKGEVLLITSLKTALQFC